MAAHTLNSTPVTRSSLWGIAVTVLAIIGVAVVEQLWTPPPVLPLLVLIPVTYTAFVGGIQVGIIAAAMSLLFATWRFSEPGTILDFSSPNAFRTIVFAIVTISIVIMVGWLRRRVDRANSDLRAHMVREVQIEERTRADFAIHDTRERYKALTQSAHDMIYVINRKGQLDFANQFAADQLGLTTAGMFGKQLIELFPAEIAERQSRDIARVFETGATVDGEDKSMLPAGERWLHTRMVGLKDAQGRVQAVLSISRDITDRKRGEDALRQARDELEIRVHERTAELSRANADLQREVTERQRAEAYVRESEERLQSILDNATAVVYLKDPEGKYLLINRHYEEVFHISRSDLVGKTDYEIFPRNVAAVFQANDRRVLDAGRAFEIEEVVPQDDGLHTYISLKFPIYDSRGRAYAVCGISTDISDRKKAQESLQAAKETAEKANNAKTRFVANISHEIRTPITAMLGAAELLMSSHESPAERLERSEMILRNGKHLLALVDDLLDLSRIDAGRLEIRRTETRLIDVLKDVLALSSAIRGEKSSLRFEIQIDSDAPETIFTDRTRLTQALGNLIHNALKFTTSGSVELRVAVKRESPDPRLYFSVVDTGPGISAQDLDRVFDPFVQVTTTMSRMAVAGVGLGLSLTKWIAESLGGSLTAESQIGQGSRFFLNVCSGPLDGLKWLDPGEIESLLLTPDPAIRPIHTTRLRGKVLLAEDAPDTQNVFACALRSAGAMVQCASNGAEALALASGEKFDLILMDIRMPEMDGVAAVRELRRQSYPAVVIALTASASPQEHHRFLEAGFDDVWQKPIPLSELIARAGDYLETGAVPEPTDLVSPQTTQRESLSELLAEAAESFVQSLPPRLAELESAAGGGDTARTRDILHQLVGSAGIHGFMELSRESARVLKLLKDEPDRPPEQLISHVTQLASAILQSRGIEQVRA